MHTILCDQVLYHTITHHINVTVCRHHRRRVAPGGRRDLPTTTMTMTTTIAITITIVIANCYYCYVYCYYSKYYDYYYY